ncbi:MAG: hypothetical protein RLZZ618_3108 [Pseudomonadota bacterium]|jgi:chromosome segregation ATPase
MNMLSPFKRLTGMRLIGMGLLACAMALPASAQDDKRASREREALRRSQQALQRVQQQHSSLEKEKASLAAEKTRLDGEVKRVSEQVGSSQAQARTARAELGKTQAERQRLQAELDTLRSASERDKQTAQARIDVLTQELAESRRLVAERTQAVQSVGKLLSRATDALGRAEQKNRDLYAIGMGLLDGYRRGDTQGSAALREPFVGLASVQRENEAERLRTEIEAQRVAGAIPPQ